MKRNLLRKEEDADPISVVSNLFDVAMVDRKSTRLNSSHTDSSRMPSSA